MRLASIGPAGAEQLCVLVGDDGMLPVSAVLSEAGVGVTDLRTVLGLWDAIEPLLAHEVEAGTKVVPLQGSRFGPPVPRPGKIVALGFNYRHHTSAVLPSVAEPDEPVVFLKPPESVCGPSDPVSRPFETEQLDYELELGVVIGKAGHRIPAVEALGHVFGYVMANDVTARDVALGKSHVHPLLAQVIRGKGFPTFCPLGPWITTASEVDDVAKLEMRLWVNEELRQYDVPGSMIFELDKLIESVSATMALQPGDLILTGTPSGCGFQLDPPRYLRAGDVIEARIDGLGEMRTVVEDERPGQ